MTKRLLCIVSAMNTGGAETFLMKIYRQLDRSKYQMDFCVNTTNNFYAGEIANLGGKIYTITPKSKNPLKWLLELRNTVKQNKYDYVIRVNEHSLSVLDLLVAKSGGAKHLIMRSSNASSGSSLKLLLHKLFCFLPKYVPTVKIAPSDLAAKFTFGNVKNVHILPNGLDTQAFCFSAEARQKIRQELKVQDKLVVGHIGRFNFQKNHKFLLEVFAQIKKQRKDAVLWLIGKGELEEQIREQAKDLGILDSVKFLGVRSDIPALLSAMDVFVFPSLFEGMPNTVIEAQTTGLPCLIADTITKQAKQTDLVDFMSLNNTSTKWADKALKIAAAQTLANRPQVAKQMRKVGYEMKDVVQQFTYLVFGGGKHA